MEAKSDSPGAVKAKESSQSVLFTYFQGDINSVVDEHFSRALNKASKPKDLSTKSRSSRRTQKSEEAAKLQWDVPAPTWPEPSFPSTSSGHIQFTSLDNPHSSSRVMSAQGGQPSSLWSFPPRPGTSFGLPPMVYSPPVPTEGPGERQYTNSFLGLLHSDRPVGAATFVPQSKPELSAGWTNPPGFRDPLGPSFGLDSGLQAPEKKKDLYWY